MLYTFNASGQAIKVEAMLLDACGIEESNEFILLYSPDGMNISDLSIDFDSTNNVGLQNDDIGTGNCTFIPGDASLIKGIQAIPANGSSKIPPGSYIIIFTSTGASTVYDFKILGYSGKPCYVLANSCIRSIGAFSNISSIGFRNTVFKVGANFSQTIRYNTDDPRLTGDGDLYYLEKIYNLACKNILSPLVLELSEDTIIHKVGEEFIVKLNVKNFRDLIAFQFAIEYNFPILKPIRIQNLNPSLISFSHGSLNIDTTNKLIKTVWTTNNTNGESLADGTLFEIVFSGYCPGGQGFLHIYDQEPHVTEVISNDDRYIPIVYIPDTLFVRISSHSTDTTTIVSSAEQINDNYRIVVTGPWSDINHFRIECKKSGTQDIPGTFTHKKEWKSEWVPCETPYTIDVFDAEGCIVYTLKNITPPCLTLDKDVSNESSFAVYQNGNELYVSNVGQAQDKDTYIRIYNLNGDVIYARNQKNALNTNVIKIDISNYSAGVYLVGIKTSEESFFKKMFIK